jgi:outer membrane protein, heavy metal efflux system
VIRPLAIPLGVCLWLTPATAVAQEPLRVEEVLAAVDRAFPLLDATRRDQEAAAGEALAARGAFDLRLSAGADRLVGDVYDHEAASVSIVQPLSFAGASVFGGYRIGQGTFAPYDIKAQTRAAGEWNAGVSLPLLRNRATDTRRAAITRTTLGQELADQRVALTRLRFLGEAAYRYWDWVAAGRQQAVAEQLLGIADARDRDLADAIALGQVAPIERVDNRRAILQRQSGVIGATRQTERQAIELSLYYRHVDGTPRRPAGAQLPADMPPAPGRVSRAEVEADIQAALLIRPDVLALDVSRRQQQVTLDLARNERLPALDVFAQMSREGGDGLRALRGREADVGVSFSLPVQQRLGRGLEQTAAATIARLDAELRFARDRVRADIEDAASALDAALQVLELARAERELARELEQAERERFDLGDSTQFLVNLRELATADAAFREISASAEAHKARVAYDVARAGIRPVTPRAAGAVP